MESVGIHGSCVVLGTAGRVFAVPGDWGVLILGESGSGKSELALQLIERGAILVADDRVELSVRNGRLCAAPNPRLAGLIEIRGLGIVSANHEPLAAIALVVRLSRDGNVARIPEREWYAPPQGLALELDARPPLFAVIGDMCSAPARILAAAGAFAHARLRFECNPP